MNKNVSKISSKTESFERKNLGKILKHIVKTLYAGHWWLTPVILATQEAEIAGTLQFEGSKSALGQTVCKTLS
jgi:hypothetical protein